MIKGAHYNVDSFLKDTSVKHLRLTFIDKLRYNELPSHLLHPQEAQLMYVSEFTQFIEDYLRQNPEVAEERQLLRGQLWEVTLKAEEQNGFQKSTVPNKPYAYQPD